MNWTIIISVVGPLLGVLVGSVFSYLIARKQYQSTSIATFRHQWISDLRNILAEFLPLSAEIAFRSDFGSRSGDNLDGHKRAVFLLNKAKLMINPHEQDHRDLIEAMNSLVNAWHKDPANALIRVSDPYERITEIGQRIFKAEWDGVRKSM